MMRSRPTFFGPGAGARWAAVAVVALAGQWAAGSAQASEPLRKASTSQAARADAIAALPLDQLGEEDRRRVEFVVKNTSIYRRLPTQVIDCDPGLYVHLLRNPEVVTNIWKAMRLSDVSLERKSDKLYRASDGLGAMGTLKVLHAGHDTHLIYAEGKYEGPIFTKPVTARCILLLRSRCLRETNGRYYITCRLDSFMHLDRAGVELVARTLQPLLGRAADHNFAETMNFVSALSRTAEVNPQGLARLVRALKKVEPKVRDEMLDITKQIAQRSSAQAARQDETPRR